ncbi:hypothetical protein AAAC51_19710 [Priestia megaterium]
MDKSILIANHKRWIKSPDIQKKEEPVMKRTFLYTLAKVTRFLRNLFKQSAVKQKALNGISIECFLDISYK